MNADGTVSINFKANEITYLKACVADTTVPLGMVGQTIATKLSEAALELRKDIPVVKVFAGNKPEDASGVPRPTPWTDEQDERAWKRYVDTIKPHTHKCLLLAVRSLFMMTREGKRDCERLRGMYDRMCEQKDEAKKLLEKEREEHKAQMQELYRNHTADRLLQYQRSERIMQQFLNCFDGNNGLGV